MRCAPRFSRSKPTTNVRYGRCAALRGARAGAAAPGRSSGGVVRILAKYYYSMRAQSHAKTSRASSTEAMTVSLLKTPALDARKASTKTSADSISPKIKALLLRCPALPLYSSDAVDRGEQDRFRVVPEHTFAIEPTFGGGGQVRVVSVLRFATSSNSEANRNH